MEEIYERELTKLQIIEGDYIYPKDLVHLKPTKHVKARFLERGLDLDILPTVVRITDDNLFSGKTQDDKHLHSVVVRLYYTYGKDMYLCYNPFDGGLKTVWFRANYKIKHDRKARGKSTKLYHKPSI